MMDWNFAQADTQELTHGLCYYPARMVPQIAARLLDTYWNKPGLILDPFAGSGTTILESLLRKHRVVGIDVNPVAICLTRGKCTLLEKPIDPAQLWEQINVNSANIQLDVDPIYMGARRNIDYWYDRPVAERLLALRQGILLYLKKTGIDSQQWVLWVTLIATVYSCSRGIQDGSSFHTRKEPNHRQDPFQIFARKLGENLARMSTLENAFASLAIHPREGTFHQILNEETACHFNLTQANSLKILNEIPEAVINGIVTSPPYGDEHSTVNYTRYTKHAAYWLGVSPAEVKKSSGETLSSRKQNSLPEGISVTEEALANIRQANTTDYEKVVHFLSDYYECLTQFQRILAPGAVCAIVIANRRVRQVEIPMDRVTTELASHAGLKQENVFHRTFPKKVVAWKTISGKSMDQENIVILRK